MRTKNFTKMGEANHVTMHSVQLQLHRLWLSIGWLLVLLVVYATLTPHPQDLPDIAVNDKIMHGISYAILMSWFLQLYNTRRTRLGIGLSLIAMGIGLEFLQYLGGVRHLEWQDILANTLGVSIAYVIVSYTPLSQGLAYFERKALKL